MPASAESKTTPGFLVVSWLGKGAPTDATRVWARAVAAAGGMVLARGDFQEIACLEIGTPPKSVIIATFPSHMSAVAAWAEFARLPAPDHLVALAGTCSPEAGAAGFPSRENAALVEADGPEAFMLVEGVVTAAEPMARYRDIIFPMISERGGYYLVYAPRDAVTVLAGEWSAHALIVSRWPDRAAARDFWYCDRYQSVAIPTRAGAGRFSVVLVPAAPDEETGQ